MKKKHNKLKILQGNQLKIDLPVLIGFSNSASQKTSQLFIKKSEEKIDEALSKQLSISEKIDDLLCRADLVYNEHYNSEKLNRSMNSSDGNTEESLYPNMENDRIAAELIAQDEEEKIQKPLETEILAKKKKKSRKPAIKLPPTHSSSQSLEKASQITSHLSQEILSPVFTDDSEEKEFKQVSKNNKNKKKLEQRSVKHISINAPQLRHTSAEAKPLTEKSITKQRIEEKPATDNTPQSPTQVIPSPKKIASAVKETTPKKSSKKEEGDLNLKLPESNCSTTVTSAPREHLESSISATSKISEPVMVLLPHPDNARLPVIWQKLEATFNQAETSRIPIVQALFPAPCKEIYDTQSIALSNHLYAVGLKDSHGRLIEKIVRMMDQTSNGTRLDTLFEIAQYLLRIGADIHQNYLDSIVVSDRIDQKCRFPLHPAAYEENMDNNYSLLLMNINMREKMKIARARIMKIEKADG